MRILIQNIKLPIEASKDEVFASAEQRLLKFFSKSEIINRAIHKRSIDARKKEDIRFVYSVVFEVKDKAISTDYLAKESMMLFREEALPIKTGEEPLTGRPLIVGFGPCGMFCALVLATNGYRPIVIERGADVAQRTEDVARFQKFGILDRDSNIQFGAGGAGTFSDGKLVTRINDNKCVYVLSEMVRLGAPAEILTQAKPHIGTDQLKNVVEAAAERITTLGGEIHYHTRLTGIHVTGNQVTSVTTNRGDLSCGALILAIGHSARDTFSMLKVAGVPLLPKAFSVGLRIEHRQEDIDHALYGNMAGNPLLPKGEYALSAHDAGGRGVYTFCMCPGGEVVAASSEIGGIVTNGMSNYRRDGVNANSAVAVSVLPEDYGGTVERAVAFQRKLEEDAYRLGGNRYYAPCETVGDFIGNTKFKEPTRILPTYRGGQVTMVNMQELLPDFVINTMRFGLCDFGRKIRGFAVNDAVLTGPETRTSSPLRIPRRDNFTTEIYDNLYPCGEGAGYAGGITSAAVDGIACSLALMERYRNY